MLLLKANYLFAFFDFDRIFYYTIKEKRGVINGKWKSF